MAEQAGSRHRYLKRSGKADTDGSESFSELVADAVDEEEARRARLASRFETLVAIVLAMAAVATAWSAYQSTRWNGEMAQEYNEAGALRSQKDGELGDFQHNFRVYDREGEKCPTRGCRGTIKRIVQGARSTFYCPVCQK